MDGHGWLRAAVGAAAVMGVAERASATELPVDESELDPGEPGWFGLQWQTDAAGVSSRPSRSPPVLVMAISGWW